LNSEYSRFRLGGFGGTGFGRFLFSAMCNVTLSI